MSKQSSVRFSDATRQQLDKLTRVTGMTQTEVIALALDRLAQSKFKAWLSAQSNDYDPYLDQEGEYKFEKWVVSE